VNSTKLHHRASSPCGTCTCSSLCLLGRPGSSWLFQTLTIFRQNGGRVSDLFVGHLINVGKIYEIVVDVFRDELGRLFVKFPGRVDECHNKVAVQKVTEFHAISFGTDYPSELGNTAIVLVALQDFGSEPWEQAAVVLLGDTRQQKAPIFQFLFGNASIMWFLGDHTMQNRLKLKDRRPSEKAGFRVLKGCDRLGLADLETESVPLDEIASFANPNVRDQTQEVVDAKYVLGNHQVNRLVETRR
jgi:hypothetical protein